MNSKNKHTINYIKEDIENILTESNTLYCDIDISKYLTLNYLFKGLIIDYRVIFKPPNIS